MTSRTKNAVAILALSAGFLFAAGTAWAEEAAAPADENPTSDVKAKEVWWPGAISIFHGYNFGVDEKYIQALAEADFGGTGISSATLDDQMAACVKQGLKVFVFIWPHEVATLGPKLTDNHDVLAYYMSDRTQPDKWGVFVPMEQTAWKSDPHHPAIFTLYAQWDNIPRFVELVKPRALEFYQYNRTPHLHCVMLDWFRVQSVNTGIPVIEIIGVGDPVQMRENVYLGLAYGVRGWRWWGGGALFDVGKLDERGVPTRTAMGDEVAKLNKAIKAYSPVYAKAVSVAVYHTPPLQDGTQQAPDDYWAKASGDFLSVGYFQDPDKNDYLVVVNRDLGAEHEATMRFAKKPASVERMDKETADWQKVELDAEGGFMAAFKVKLDAGSGELYRVKRAAE